MTALDFVDASGSTCVHALCEHLMRYARECHRDVSSRVTLAISVLCQRMSLFAGGLLARNAHGYLPYELLEMFPDTAQGGPDCRTPLANAEGSESVIKGEGQFGGHGNPDNDGVSLQGGGGRKGDGAEWACPSARG